LGEFVTRSIAGSFHTIGGRAAGSILLMSCELQLDRVARGDADINSKRTDPMQDPKPPSQQTRPTPAVVTLFMGALIVVFVILHALAGTWLHQALPTPQSETSRPAIYND
jgi:hypothetical protein